MKSLYESILDDEEVQISDIKKAAKNPFIVLRHVFDSIDFDNDRDSYKKWRDICKKELSKVDLPEDVKISYLNTFIYFVYKDTTIFVIEYDNKLSKEYTCPQFSNYETDKKLKPRYRKIPGYIINWIEKIFNKKYGFEEYPKNKIWKVIK